LPDNLVGYFKTFSIYDQSDNSEFSRKIAESYPNSIPTINSGHSLSHYFAYIIENWNELPDYVVFLKSNVVPRHIDAHTFERCIDLARLKSGYVSFFNDENFKDKTRIAYHIYPGLFLERNNSWYVKRLEKQYFNDFNQLLNFLFINPKLPEFVPFTPGACFGVTSSQIHRIPLEVWKFLEEITTYRYFPSEAYLVERVLFILLHAPYEIQPYFISESDSWRVHLRRIQTETQMEALKPKKIQAIKFKKIKQLVYQLIVKVEAKLRFELDSRF
jgi:hypothetical protein